jgi:hypothetical protein
MTDTPSATPDFQVARTRCPHHFTATRFGLGLAVLLAVAFSDVLFGWRSFFTRDFANFGYPLAYHVQQSYRAGEVPLWNPYNVAGLPFLAQWNTLALYPPSLIYVLLPLPWSLNFFNLLHLHLAGLGMFCLARRWLRHGGAAAVAGVGYAFSGLVVSALMWPNNIAALGWLPLVLLFGERAARRGGGCCIQATVVLALQFLSGAPEITALTCSGLLVLALFASPAQGVSLPRRLGRLLLVFGAGGGVAAAQLLPFLELLSHSQRGAGFSSGNWALSWSGLGNFLVPLFHTIQSRDRIFFQTSQQWVTSYYPAMSVVLAAWIGLWAEKDRRVRWLGALAALSLVLALGPNALVYDWLRRLVPILEIMRYPVKFLVPVLVILPLLAGYGVRAWFQGKVRLTTLWVLVLVLAVSASALMSLNDWRPAPGETPAAVWRSGWTALAGLGAFAATLTWSIRWVTPQARWLPAPALALLIFGDLSLANRHVNPVVYPDLLRGRAVTLEPRPEPGRGRVLVTAAAQEQLDNFNFTSPEAAVRIPRLALLLNDNLLERIPKLDGFFSLYLPRAARLTVRLSQQTNAVAGLMDFLGVSHLSRPGRPWEWEARTNWMPLLALAPRAVFLDPTNALKTLFSGQFNPRELVCLGPEAAGNIRFDGGARGAVVPAQMSAHLLEATVDTDGPMLLTIAQANYPGWRATVDGRPSRIWTANYAFQALEVPPGRHAIRVQFRSASFELGAGITSFTLVVLFVWHRANRGSIRRVG